MRFLAPLAVVALLVAIQAVFGGAILLLGTACQSLIDDCLRVPGVALFIGLVALIVALTFARRVISAGSRKRRRHPAPVPD